MFRLPTLRIEGAVGEIFYIHKKRKSLSSAFETRENVNVYIQIPTNLAATEVKMHIFSDGDAKAKTLCASWIKRKRDREYYKINILPKLSTGLYFFDISVKALDTDLFAARGENGYLTFIEEPPSQKFQLTVSDFKYKAPKDKYGGVIYQIFVDRFSRGEKILKKKDGIYPEVFDPIPEYPEYPGAPLKNNTFYGGNLSGIIENLDYFQKLGVNMLYLTPIFESVSNHKYDTADYMRIDSGFGGEETLRELIEKASEYGIGIILDGVFNHTGADSVYFNKYGRYKTLGAYNSRKSEYYEW